MTGSTCFPRTRLSRTIISLSWVIGLYSKLKSPVEKTIRSRKSKDPDIPILTGKWRLLIDRNKDSGFVDIR